MLKFLRSKAAFNRKVITLLMGTTIAQAIPIAISPILTRIFSPEDFGVFALYVSLLTLFGTIVTGRYELAILIPKEDSLAKNIVIYTIALSFITSMLLYIILIIFFDEIISALNNSDIKKWIFFLPVNIFIVASMSILYYWNNRKEYYADLSQNHIIQASMQGSTNVTLGTFANISSGLIIGNMLANFVSFLHLLKVTLPQFKGFRFKKNKSKYLMVKYINFPKYMIASSLLENVSVQIPVYVLTILSSSTVVGFYSLSQRVVKAPIMAIGTSVGNVFRQEASLQLARDGNCRQFFIDTLKSLVILSTIPFIMFFLFSPVLFSFIFGKEWIIAGEYAQILTLLFYLQFIVNPLSNMLIVAEKQNYCMYMQLFLIVGASLAFLIGHYYFESVKASLIIFTVVYSTKYIYELIISYKFTIKSEC